MGGEEWGGEGGEGGGGGGEGGGLVGEGGKTIWNWPKCWNEGQGQVKEGTAGRIRWWVLSLTLKTPEACGLGGYESQCI